MESEKEGQERKRLRMKKGRWRGDRQREEIDREGERERRWTEREEIDRVKREGQLCAG